MRKNLLQISLLLITSFLFSTVSWGQNVVIDFGIDAQWGGSGSGYQSRSYADQGFNFAASDAIRETDAARRIGAYSWRLRNGTLVATNTTEATYEGFSIQVRPWGTNEPQTANPFQLRYSINGGDDWTTVESSITGVNPVVWLTYSASFDEKDFEIGELVVEIVSPNVNNQRLNLGEFTAFVPLGGDPVVIADPDNLSGFFYGEGNGPSDTQSFSVSGENLTSSGATLTLGDGSGSNFEIETNVEAISFEDEILDLSSFDGTSTTVFVRLKEGLSVGAYSETITISGGGADPITIELEGEVLPAPPSLTAIDVAYEQDFESFNSFETLPNGWVLGKDNYIYRGNFFSSTTTGGIYGNGALGIVMTGTAPNRELEATLTLINNTGQIIEALEIEYEALVSRLDVAGNPSWTISIDGEEVSDLSYSTSELEDRVISAILTDISIAPESVITFVWKTERQGTSAQKKIGFRNVSIKPIDKPDLIQPIFSLVGGTYFEDQTVFITNFEDYASGVDVFYTLDGTEPTSSSLVYDDTTGILIEDGNGEVILSAIAIDGAQESPIATRTYTFPINVADIETLRAQSTGSTIYRVANEATLIGQTSFRNTKFFQDDSGFGIQIDDVSGIITSTYDLNDNVASLVGTLGVFQGQLQFVPSIDFGASVSSGNTVTPVTRTLDNLGFDDQARLVVVENVSFTDGDGINTFGAGGFVTSINDSTTGNYRNIFGESNITGAIIPEYQVNLVGVVQQLNSEITVGARSLDDITPTAAFFYSDGVWNIDPVGTSTDVDDILVIDGTVAINDNLIGRDLQVATGATLNVTSSGVLNLAGNIINNGDLVFQSDANGAGQLASFSGTITGNVTAERFIPARRAFRFLSSPVGGVAIADSWQQNTHITGSTDGSNGFDETVSGAPSMFSFDHDLGDQTGTNVSAAWLPIASTTQDIVAGRPYRLFVRGDRTVSLANNEAPATDVTLSATGNLHVGDYPVTVSNFVENFTFIGNPYQAVVDISEIDFGDDVNSNFAYYRDPSLHENGGFIAIALPSGNLAPVPNPGSSNANNFLRPGQAVFVRNNDSGSNFDIEITEAAKATSESQTQVFSTTTTAFVNARLYTTDKFNNGQIEEDAVGLRFLAEGNNAIDPMDAVKMGNPGVNLALVNGNTPLAIETRALPEATEEVQLFMNNVHSNNYTFRFHTENLPMNTKVFIKDAYLDTQTEVEAGIDTYSFTIDSSIEASASPFRFSFVFEDTTLSTDQFDLTTSVEVYPNPTTNVLNVRSKMLANQEVDVKILDVLGRSVQNLSIFVAENATIEVNTSELQQGLYFINVSTSTGETLSERFIKK